MTQLQRLKHSRLLLVGSGAAAVVLMSAWLLLISCQDDQDDLRQIGLLYDNYRKSFPQVPVVSVQQLRTMQENGNVVLIDVREDPERQVSMIPGAVSPQEFEQRLESYNDNIVVTYCTIGYRSGVYAKTLLEKGFRAYNLKGGILSWIHAGHELNDQKGPTHRVHVYGKQWNLVPQVYDAVW